MTATTQTANDAQNMTADEAAEVLVDNMTAAQIRKWMSENGLSRTRGARKYQSALLAFEQDEEKTIAKAEELLAALPRFHVVCGHCGGLDEWTDDAEEAETTAKEHKSANNTHFPRAIDTVEGGRIYG